jgi:plasmid stability protein
MLGERHRCIVAADALVRREEHIGPLWAPGRNLTVAVRSCYRDMVKNITVTVPDEVYRAARIRAAEEGRSVSGMVTNYLRSLTGRDAEYARMEAQQRRIQAQIKRFRAADRLSRDEVHDRAVR